MLFRKIGRVGYLARVPWVTRWLLGLPSLVLSCRESGGNRGSRCVKLQGNSCRICGSGDAWCWVDGPSLRWCLSQLRGVCLGAYEEREASTHTPLNHHGCLLSHLLTNCYVVVQVNNPGIIPLLCPYNLQPTHEKAFDLDRHESIQIRARLATATPPATHSELQSLPLEY